ELTQVLRHLVPFKDAAVLVDATTSDDAAVYRVDAERALVATVDFFTPIVDDPRDFGRIAAANALSDIYAMGARPLFALNLVGFPRAHLGTGVLEEILRGGGEIAREAGIAIIGGHSIDDAEPKFGLCVIGEVAPDGIVRNSTACAEGMTALNGAAAEAMLRAGASAATDVTGFGLLGHLREMARGSRLAAIVRASAVPLLPTALELAERGVLPGGSKRNFDDVAD